MKRIFKKLMIKKQYILLILVLFFGLVFRLAIVTLAFHVDIYSLADWGKWIYLNGAGKFYENNIWSHSWPTQFPIFNLTMALCFYLYDQLTWLFANLGVIIATYRLAPTYFYWFFNFSQWFGNALYADTNFRIGQLITIKILPIGADVLVGYLIYLFGKKWNKFGSLVVCIIYLFSPLSWYLSSLWGQYESVMFLLLFLAFYLLFKREFILTPTLLFVSIGIKPVALIFVPIFIYLYLRSSPKLFQLVGGVILLATVAFLTTNPFIYREWDDFLRGDIYSKVFEKSETRLANSGFTFWRMTIGNASKPDEDMLFIINYKVYGVLLAVLVNIVAMVYLLKVRFQKMDKEDLERVLFALCFIGFGSGIFLTNIAERYFFPGIVFGLIYLIFNPKFALWWFCASMVFIVGLYNSWLFPEKLIVIREVLYAYDVLGVRIMSFVNLALFGYIFYYLLRGIKHEKSY